MLASSFSRYETWKATAKLISGVEWLTINKDGKGVVMTAGASPTPPCDLFMGFASCHSNAL